MLGSRTADNPRAEREWQGPGAPPDCGACRGKHRAHTCGSRFRSDASEAPLRAPGPGPAPSTSVGYYARAMGAPAPNRAGQEAVWDDKASQWTFVRPRGGAPGGATWEYARGEWVGGTPKPPPYVPKERVVPMQERGAGRRARLLLEASVSDAAPFVLKSRPARTKGLVGSAAGKRVLDGPDADAAPRPKKVDRHVHSAARERVVAGRVAVKQKGPSGSGRRRRRRRDPTHVLRRLRLGHGPRAKVHAHRRRRRLLDVDASYSTVARSFAAAHVVLPALVSAPMHALASKNGVVGCRGL